MPRALSHGACIRVVVVVVVVVVVACGLSPRVGVASVVGVSGVGGGHGGHYWAEGTLDLEEKKGHPSSVITSTLQASTSTQLNWYCLCTRATSSTPGTTPCTQAHGHRLQLIATHKSATTATPYSTQETPQCHPTQRAIRRYDTDNDGNQVDDDDVAEGDGSGEVEGDGHSDAEGSGDSDVEDNGNHRGRW
ncbi:hypothetical protein EDB86DRAFT_2836918 [Lactarius hatsudake]|nr:hypothetical protein EDB86DRAFT_2836918 [Lactarius hatsudake]